MLLLAEPSSNKNHELFPDPVVPLVDWQKDKTAGKDKKPATQKNTAKTSCSYQMYTQWDTGPQP
jgi:hypothetical protein